MSLLEVQNLQKSFGPLRAVDGVSFNVEAGEIFGLLGPNGAGKSTTMSMIAGLLTPEGGEIRLDGKTFDPTDHDFRRLLGVVPQDLAIYPEMSARENLNFFARLYGLRGEKLKKQIDLALERTGLGSRADDSSGHFSGGMKRRLNFGIALLHSPKLLILDEPTVGVDPQSRAHLLDSVRKASDEGMAVIYASHYMEEVQALCKRVAIIDHGKMLACDTITALLSRLSTDLRLRIGQPQKNLMKRLVGIAELKTNDDGQPMLVIAQDAQRKDQDLNASITKILGILAETGTALYAIETHEPNLERLFLQMTGNKLRD
jgi:ABC-2 type transport system ATP-binding protein